MIIDRNVYNVPKVDFGDLTVSVKTEVGTKKDFEKISKMVEKSGMMVATCAISSIKKIVACNASKSSDGIDFGGVVHASGTPAAFTGLLELGTSTNANKCYVTVASTALGAGGAKAATTRTTSTK